MHLDRRHFLRAGSAAFICGTLLSGQAISRFGITAALCLNAGLLAATAVAARLVPVLLLPTKDGTRPMMADVTRVCRSGVYSGVAAMIAANA